ncbi:M20/M25/M40 family metallo-hydrolase [Pseudohoeflea coraliihabitans]|uniref:M20/M25/M40 family metallo-hydrolase n=1 Tax=Pseudohoeflea coraliihabitans TaxID=2860393 RepID=A0ABS6WNE9_9HYPH|nr:M20/M25/M40 family metallo-hydrolase [Pseudohoeflea sp. DP4N28-3]MBW3097481.1 M20/M25/M40 family metallo-hydrolase [Pseudohoeflea sp. DP4N28-3]
MPKISSRTLFNARDLPFDSGAMAADLKRWVDQESPTYDADAVNRMMDVASRDLAMLGADLQRLPGHGGYGDCVKATLPHSRRGAPGILVLGHMDTVHPVGTIAHFPFREEKDRCYGPGILDMKAGNFLSLEAIRQLQRAGIDTPLPITVMFTSDEEVGSPSTRALIEAEARRHRFVLVPEPARRNGGVVTGRYAIARFRITTVGQPSHAGLRLSEGVSAIREMAQQIIAIEAMTDKESGFSVGVVRGGEWANCVATTCHAEVLVSATTHAVLERAIERMHGLKPKGAGSMVKVEQSVVRPVWEKTAASWAVYETAKGLAADLGFDLPFEVSGGGSDGNFTGALGVPTLDGLGARGDGPHTLEEHIVTESLAERGRLMAALLATLD